MIVLNPLVKNIINGCLVFWADLYSPFDIHLHTIEVLASSSSLEAFLMLIEIMR